MNFPRLALAVVLLAPVAAWANRDVTVVVDMTPEGRNAVHPTPDHPAYYMPVMRGYQESGDLAAGEKPLSEHEVIHVVAPELAKQGYRVIDAEHGTADLVINIAWGQIAPSVAGDVVTNQPRLNALALGHTITDVMLLESAGHDEFMEATNDTRYYVIVTAYDYTAWAKQHKHVMLWKAKMSVPSSGIFFDVALAPLVMAGGPSFGHETIGHPKVVSAVPEGRVEIGTPTVKNDSDTPPATKPK